jgi:hypothetical protein
MLFLTVLRASTGNPLPPPPNTYDTTQLREDTSAERCVDENERRYRHHVLSMFQVLVGALDKPKIQLIVLDMKRVKMKWSHNFGTEGDVAKVGARGNKGDRAGEAVEGAKGDKKSGSKSDKGQSGQQGSAKKRGQIEAVAATTKDMTGESDDDDDDDDDDDEDIYAIRRNRERGRNEPAAMAAKPTKKKESQKKRDGKAASTSRNDKVAEKQAPAQPRVHVTQGVLGNIYSSDGPSVHPSGKRASGVDESSKGRASSAVFEDVDVAMTDIGEVAAPAARGEGGRSVGDSGVLAVKVFKKKASASASSQHSGKGDAVVAVPEDKANKKRKEVRAGGEREDAGISEVHSKKTRVVARNEDTASVFAMPSANSAVFGLGGSSQW